MQDNNVKDTGGRLAYLEVDNHSFRLGDLGHRTVWESGLKFKIKTLLLLAIPFAVFFAGVSRSRVASIHVGMEYDKVKRILRESALAVEVPCPRTYPVRVQTSGFPGWSTFWKVPSSSDTIETHTYHDDVLATLYLNGNAIKKLEIYNLGQELIASNELTAEEHALEQRNRRPAIGFGRDR